jgi:pimeloyl-ACP methyl ester carboxylesterase
MAPESVVISEDRVVLDPQALRVLRERLARPSLPPALLDGWEQGVPREWLRELLEDWRTYDTDGLQYRLDGLTHLRARIGDHAVHLIHSPAPGTQATPLLLTHGWPGSFLEHLPILPMLTQAPAQAFSVVIPSLPGFGFSGPPPAAGLTHRAVAALWNRLMTDGLGYTRYVAHGSDLGAGVTAWLARDYPENVAGIHVATPGLPPGREAGSPAEAAYAAESAAWAAEEGGYAHQQATKPSTLSAALHDNPVGLAAWIGEKAVAWSSTRSDGESAFDRDALLATLTLYWTTGTIGSSLLPYWIHRHTANAALPLDDPSDVPTAVSVFGGERVPFPKPPRSLGERYYRVASWDEHDRGGHFPALAEPRLLASTLRRTLHHLAQADRKA